MWRTFLFALAFQLVLPVGTVWDGVCVSVHAPRPATGAVERFQELRQAPNRILTDAIRSTRIAVEFQRSSTEKIPKLGSSLPWIPAIAFGEVHGFSPFSKHPVDAFQGAFRLFLLFRHLLI